ncbi:unnamed protein product [Acanthoscelides obtectus]|uniref:Uncharacterized protein n=1 Tax=Acanthoscelides obtectus TaxID=200917 RepID=A0A9P0NSN9_ACAOB|nr:unnamed protein product [Acanthoscelides obtectus]CAK1641362.1 hypothetical protein AOBTE_LOCUS12361 [Acanthoscelides obtectus]
MDRAFFIQIHFAPEMWKKVREDRKLKNNAYPTIFSFTKAKPKRKPPTQREAPASVSPIVVDNEEEIVDPTSTKKMTVPSKSHSFDSSESQVYDADMSKSRIPFNTLGSCFQEAQVMKELCQDLL